MALNSIAPRVMIARRHGKWAIRFRLPADVAELYTLPKLPRLTSRLSGIDIRRMRRGAYDRVGDRIGGPWIKYWNRRSDPEMHRAQQELDHSLTVAALMGRTHPAGSVTDPL